MSRKLAPWLIALAATAITAGTAAPALAAPIIDPVPIGPNQHFEGLVNGKTDHAIIVTDHCLTTPLGLLVAHPAPGQHIRVVRDADSDGFTGSAAHAIDVQFPSPPPVVNSPVVLHSYNVPTPIPVSLTVPCSGPGTVTFVPEPTSKTAVTETVNVTFVLQLPPTPTPSPIPTPRPTPPPA